MIAVPYPFKNEIYAVEVENAKILSVYWLSEEDRSLPYDPVANRLQLETSP
ncbi:MAG: hypothetical protein JEZ00_18120 [Anaerolineaceae bacterium]|nr:hypothetical protein [Anaerolineaceae bacterium]